jgi:hypothetical protein
MRQARACPVAREQELDMKAVGYLEAGGIEREDSLIDLELPVPEPGARDLRVKVAAVSVNPVDTKVRKSRAPQGGKPEVLGWDAVGVVDAVGAEVSGFQVGERGYYAGVINRPVVKSRIKGHRGIGGTDAGHDTIAQAAQAWRARRVVPADRGGEGRGRVPTDVERAVMLDAEAGRSICSSHTTRMRRESFQPMDNRADGRGLDTARRSQALRRHGAASWSR